MKTSAPKISTRFKKISEGDKYAENRPITSNSSSSASSSSSNSNSSSVEPYNLVVTAPDGGWAWAVCAASFMCMFITDGMLFTYGIFYVEFLDYFQQGKGKTALVGSIFMGMSMFFGPFTSIMINIWGLRAVSIAGSLLATASFACSVLAPNLEVLIFTYGVMGGCGVAMIYVCSILAVGFYFDKKRAIANGITSSGSGIGTFVFSPLCTWLIDVYSWKGAMLILSGITFHCLVFCSLYRPIRAKKDFTSQYVTCDDDVDESKYLNATSDNKVVGIGLQTSNLGLSNASFYESDYKTQSVTDISKNKTSSERIKRKLQTQYPVNTVQMKSQSRSDVNTYHTCHNIYALASPVEPYKLCHSSSNVYPTSHNKIAHFKPKPVFLNPLDKKDIFYSGSLININKNIKNSNLIVTADDELFDDVEINNIDEKTSKKSLSRVAGLHLLYNPLFLLIVLYSVLWTTHSTILTILPHYSLECGASDGQASTLISVIGAANTIARILIGWLASRKGVNPLWIVISALLLGGFSCLLMPFIPNYIALLVLAVTFGCCMGTWTSLRPIILVQLLGINNLTNALGLLAMFQGLAFSVGPPVAGILRDVTESYKLPFLLSGSAFILSGCVCIVIYKLESYFSSSRTGCLNCKCLENGESDDQ